MECQSEGSIFPDGWDVLAPNRVTEELVSCPVSKSLTQLTGNPPASLYG